MNAEAANSQQEDWLEKSQWLNSNYMLNSSHASPPLDQQQLAICQRAQLFFTMAPEP